MVTFPIDHVLNLNHDSGGRIASRQLESQPLAVFAIAPFEASIRIPMAFRHGLHAVAPFGG